MDKKLEKNQVLYINNNLKKNKSCVLIDKLPQDINTISTPIVKNILKNKFNNGPDMNAILCMFDNLFLSTKSTKSKQDGLYHLSMHVSKWVKKMKKLKVSSTAGYVYISDILSDIQIIIKLPQNHHDYNDMIREYFIGISSINKLRYTLPNFVYTFGAFICPFENEKICNGEKKDSFPFVVFEKIPGNTMQKMLSKNKLTFSQYLGMFIQILLALEVSQRDISFTHFDFHTSNLMCRNIKSDCKYNVPLDNQLYEVTAKKFLPVIIDFGLSTVKHDGVVVGSYTFPEHGMYHYMIPGVDMFKFLYHSLSNSNGDLQKQISNLMSFYGDDDPYKVLVNGDESIDNAIDEYIKEGSYSRVAMYTPLEFLNWILEKPEYSDITSIYMKKKERDVYIPLCFSTTIQTYDDIFNYTKNGRDQAIKYIKEYAISDKYTGSYLMSMYSIYVLCGYNKKLMSKELEYDIKILKNNVKKYSTDMIDNDMKMLYKYKKLLLSSSDITQIKNYSKHILEFKINFVNSTDKIKVFKLIEKYYNNTSFFTDILPYLQFIYTIKEVNLCKIYSKFLSSFMKSYQYRIYNQNYTIINNTNRWCQTLLDSCL